MTSSDDSLAGELLENDSLEEETSALVCCGKFCAVHLDGLCLIELAREGAEAPSNYISCIMSWK